MIRSRRETRACTATAMCTAITAPLAVGLAGLPSLAMAALGGYGGWCVASNVIDRRARRAMRLWRGART